MKSLTGGRARSMPGSRAMTQAYYEAMGGTASKMASLGLAQKLQGRLLSTVWFIMQCT